MRILLQGLALAALSACSATTAATDLSRSDAIVTSDERLTLTVADAPTRPGIMFVAGTVVGGLSKIVVSSTRYGSVCATNITAHADVDIGKITLVVNYAERTVVCTTDFRAITYHAEIGGLSPGMYDVNVVHTNADGSGGPVLAQRVKVD